MCGALKRFYAKEKRLPVNGTISDMTSLPEWYIALQHVYRNKGLADIELIKGHISEILTERGMDQIFLPKMPKKLLDSAKTQTLYKLLSF